MANLINNKEELKEYCLRKCGKPVIEINIDDSQINDAIDDALKFFAMYHYEGAQRVFVSKQITQQDIDNGYINIDSLITDVVRVFGPKDMSNSSGNMFDIEYIIQKEATLSLANGIGTSSIVSYYLAQDSLGVLNDMFTSSIRFRHKRATHRLYIDEHWGSTKGFSLGQYIVYEAFSEIDPEEYIGLYNNSILRNLAAAYIKLRWGNNLIKMSGIELPGGITLNGEYIVNEAREEIEKIETDFIMKFQEPDDFMIG